MDRGRWPVAVMPLYSNLNLVIFVAVVVIADIVFAVMRRRSVRIRFAHLGPADLQGAHAWGLEQNCQARRNLNLYICHG